MTIQEFGKAVFELIHEAEKLMDDPHDQFAPVLFFKTGDQVTLVPLDPNLLEDERGINLLADALLPYELERVAADAFAFVVPATDTETILVDVANRRCRRTYVATIERDDNDLPIVGTWNEWDDLSIRDKLVEKLRGILLEGETNVK